MTDNSMKMLINDLMYNCGDHNEIMFNVILRAWSSAQLSSWAHNMVQCVEYTGQPRTKDGDARPNQFKLNSDVTPPLLLLRTSRILTCNARVSMSGVTITPVLSGQGQIRAMPKR